MQEIPYHQPCRKNRKSSKS